jgi:hypothetical protein
MVCLIYNRCVCGSRMETLLRFLRVIVDHDFQTMGLQEHAALNVLVTVITLTLRFANGLRPS